MIFRKKTLPDTIELQGEAVPLRVSSRKAQRRMILRYEPQKHCFALSIPSHCSARKVESFLRDRHTWMEQAATRKIEKIPLIFGAVVPVLGEEMEIAPKAGDGMLHVLATPPKAEKAALNKIKGLLRHYIKAQAAGLSARIGEQVTGITLRDTKSRWGSCSASGRLNFSWRLAFAPKQVMDYIIAHEVAHLREAHHGPEFWQLVAEIHPSYKEDAAWLKAHGDSLFRYGSE